MSDSWVERFNDWLVDWMCKYMLIGLLAFILGAVGLGLWIGFSQTAKPFVCAHEPHMGACKVQVTTYYHNAATNTMVPIQADCGCVSSHGAVILTK